MKKTFLALITVILIAVIGASSFGIYSIYNPSATPTPSASPTPEPTATPTVTASPESTPTPTLTPSPSASVTSSPTATPEASPSETPQVTSTPEPTQSVAPSASPSVAPSASPSVAPSASPTVQPTVTATPTPEPTASPTPSPTPKPESITYTDVTGANVIVKLPVNRVVSVMATDLVTAIGAHDRIVGRGNIDATGLSLLPAAIADIPVAGSVETVLEMAPDLVIVSELYGDANVELLRNAGLAVIVDRTVQPRRSILVHNLGIMLDAEEMAEEFNSFEAHYMNLVTERVQNLTDSQKPTVYFEFYMPGYSCGPGNSFHDLIVEAGGINIANETVAMPILSAEYVLEKNPDIIVRMLTYLDGFELSSFKYLQTEMMSRAGMSEVTAVKNGDVYIVRDAVIVSRETIGLLYYATWFHPDLFADIDPAAVDAEYLQKFYGVSLTGVYTYS
ncbi:MAG: ABC transporter substrate-binding protein [Candidatus Bathyarchaeota archaeon]|nr:ABC transporter substrate-binding protein [Candidatus Bathyarchaeota archaeon]